MTQPQHSSQPTPRHRKATSNAAPASHTAAPGRHATHAANGQRRASGSTVAGARAPINAAQAAKRAAHAAPGETVRYRQEAAGVSRERAQALGKTGPRSHAPVIAGAIVGIALACLLIWFVGGAALRAFMDDGTTDEVIVADFENADAKEAPKAVDADGTLEVMGFNYTFAPADGGTYTLARQLTDSTADPVPLFTVTGTPAGMATYGGFIYVMSNGEGSYYIQSYLPGDGSLPSDLADGEGTIVNVALEGSQLQLTEEGGRVYTLELSRK